MDFESGVWNLERRYRMRGAAVTAAAIVAMLVFASATDAEVVTLDKNNLFQIYEPDRVWIVEFFAPWCGHCQRLAPIYAKAAEQLDGMVSLGAVNCDDHRDICGAFQVQGFPTLKVFGPDVSPNPEQPNMPFKEPKDYQGGRDVKSIVNHGLAMLPNHVKRVSKTADFFDSELPKVLLFTNKKKTPPIFKVLATEFRKVADFGEVREADKDVVSKYGVEKFPTIALDRGDDVTTYEGKVSLEGLRKWLESAKLKGAKTEFKKPEPEPVEVFDVSTAEEFAAACDPEKWAFCNILFVDSYADNEAYTTMFGKLAAEFQNSASTAFIVIDGSSQYNMLEALGATAGLPSVVLFDLKTKEAQVYAGIMEQDSVKSFLNRGVGRGLLASKRRGWRKLPGETFPAFAAPYVSSGDDDDDDLYEDDKTDL